METTRTEIQTGTEAVDQANPYVFLTPRFPICTIRGKARSSGRRMDLASWNLEHLLTLRDQ